MAPKRTASEIDDIKMAEFKVERLLDKPRKLSRTPTKGTTSEQSTSTPLTLPKSEPPSARKPKLKAALTHRPSESYDIYVFGSNEEAQLGFGLERSETSTLKSPRLHHVLSAEGVVQVACGASHGLALTRDGRVLSWGCNDVGALGRDTTCEEDNGIDAVSGSRTAVPASPLLLNPRENTPTAIDAFPVGTNITQVAASEAASFALTQDGTVWAWGTFQSNEGSIGLISTAIRQPLYQPTILPTFKNLKIVRLAASAGSNHILALSESGTVHTIGTGEQNQLGRKLVERNKGNGLIVGTVSFPDPHSGIRDKANTKIKSTTSKSAKVVMVDVAVGNETSFSIDERGRVWSWGKDNFAQLGHRIEIEKQPNMQLTPGKKVGESHAPALVDALDQAGPIAKVAAGKDFAIAVNGKGECFGWGRVDGLALGLQVETLKMDDLRAVGRTPGPKTLIKAAHVADVADIVDIAAGSGHVIVINATGEAYGWGAGGEWRLGSREGLDLELPVRLYEAVPRIFARVAVGREYGMLCAIKEAFSAN